MLINLTYKGNPNTNEMISLIGKGVVYDTGGLSLKPTSNMEKMYKDMHGSVSTLAAFIAAVELGTYVFKLLFT